MTQADQKQQKNHNAFAGATRGNISSCGYASFCASSFVLIIMGIAMAAVSVFVLRSLSVLLNLVVVVVFLYVVSHMIFYEKKRTVS